MLRITLLNVCVAAVLAGLAITLAGGQAKQSSRTFDFPSDADIRKMLAERVEALAAKEDGIGIVVALVGPQGRRFISYGHFNQGDPRSVDGETAFESGSVTKVFTALLFAEMVRKGEVALTDPVAKYLPSVRIPERSGRAITLVDLATHTSGLPFMPDELPALNDSAETQFGAAKLYQFLARYQLPRDIGSEWEYSNIGYWLLGEALASRASMDFESLLQKRVIAPLKLKSTAITLSPKMNTKLAVGHNSSLQPAQSISTVPFLAVMPQAGGLYSTANDLSTLLSVAMGYENSPLTPAMATTLTTRRPTPQPEVVQALGWMLVGKGDDQLILHDGGTLGYASSVAWDQKKRIGVVVLSNHVANVNDIARHLLRPNIPLAKPSATKHTEVTIDLALLSAYAGQYGAPDEGVFIVVKEGDFLTIQSPVSWGLPKLRLRPESPRNFFVAELPLRVTFQTDKNGRVNGLLIYPPRGQQAISASRISSDK